MFKSHGTHFGYLIHFPLTRLWSRFYFRLHVMRNAENIPQKDGAVIVANHQNAFLDAFLIAAGFKDQIRSMTRADVFKNPVLARVLQQHGNIPIYRERDGRDGLAKNEEIFALTSDALAHNGKVLVFPEANCVVEKRIRPIKKGAARMAFLGLAKLKPGQQLNMMPCGLTYSDHTAFRGYFQLKFGTPISISQMHRDGDNEAKILLSATRQTEAQIKELTIDYPADVNDDALDLLLDIVAASRIGRPRFRAQKLAAWFDFQEAALEKLKSLPHEQRQDLLEKAGELFAQLPGGKAAFPALDPKSSGDKIRTLGALLVTSPLALLGLLTIRPVTALAESIISRKAKEKQFITSGRFVIGMLGSTYWWLILAAATGLTFGLTAAIAALPLLVGISWAALHWYDVAAELLEHVKLPDPVKELRETILKTAGQALH